MKMSFAEMNFNEIALTNSKNVVVTRAIALLGIDTFPVITMKSTFSLTPVRRYPLSVTTRHRYPTHTPQQLTISKGGVPKVEKYYWQIISKSYEIYNHLHVLCIFSFPG